MRNVVLLVDNKRRDLMVAALIARQLEGVGVHCILEPLEAYQGVLSAYHPSLIIFNHLTAGHLVKYSQRLADLGVLTAVLPNEGILYDRHVLDYNAGKHHQGSHIDLFFCWNEPHREALRKCGWTNTQVEVVGVPRFDFYFSPWSRVFQPAGPARRDKPRVLFCTNFVFAKCKFLPRAQVDNVFGQWRMIPAYQNHLELIDANFRSRNRVFPFLAALVAAGKYDLVLRPHPGEDMTVYRQWVDALPPAERSTITLDADTNITELILGCDLEISCETCTTALESWIARKPTIELLLEKHPVFYHEPIARMNATCENPKALVSLIDQQLTASLSPSWEEARRQHLRTWCHAPDGTSSLRMARIIADRLRQAPEPDWSQLTFSDHRRAAKLKLTRAIGQAYQFDPLLPLKSRLFKGRYQLKANAYKKSILPRDVHQVRLKLAVSPTAQAA